MREVLVDAVDFLVENQRSETLILSSYKINTVFKTHLGINFRVDRIGRALSRFAKKRNLERLSTNIPKYKLIVSEYKSSKDSTDSNVTSEPKKAKKSKRPKKPKKSKKHIKVE
ncbi:MAG: hypothetical protein ACTSRE_06175 [Promethearchaeota archaeon]